MAFRKISLIDLVASSSYLLTTLCLLFLASCQSESTQSTHEAEKSYAAELGAFPNYFEGDIVEATAEIKLAFEDGLRDYFNTDRQLDYLYEQHARRLRDHYFAQESFAGIFPFNGALEDSLLLPSWEQLPFVTFNCGFQIKEDEVINFLCPAIDDTYFTYLRETAAESGPIAKFAEEYPVRKDISPSFRQNMLLRSIEDLDLANPDHQLFYAFFQLWINDEMQARQKVISIERAQKAAAEKED